MLISNVFKIKIYIENSDLKFDLHLHHVIMNYDFLIQYTVIDLNWTKQKLT